MTKRYRSTTGGSYACVAIGHKGAEIVFTCSDPYDDGEASEAAAAVQQPGGPAPANPPQGDLAKLGIGREADEWYELGSANPDLNPVYGMLPNADFQRLLELHQLFHAQRGKSAKEQRIAIGGSGSAGFKKYNDLIDELFGLLKKAQYPFYPKGVDTVKMMSYVSTIVPGAASIPTGLLEGLAATESGAQPVGACKYGRGVSTAAGILQETGSYYDSSRKLFENIIDGVGSPVPHAAVLLPSIACIVLADHYAKAHGDIDAVIEGFVGKDNKDAFARKKASVDAARARSAKGQQAMITAAQAAYKAKAKEQQQASTVPHNIFTAAAEGVLGGSGDVMTEEQGA